jgi:uncharacterized membrane protein
MADDTGEPAGKGDLKDKGTVPAVITPEELERIPDPQLRNKVEVLFQQRFEMIRSPLLPPEVLDQYGKVVPGLPDRFVKWTEEESEHRRAMERAAFEEVRTLRARAQLAGFIVAIAGLATAGYIASTTDSFAAALAASVCAIVGVGGPFAARVLASRWASGRTDHDE